tara:strand:- start:857 stop:1126 length:270 start_codon:yes stop_codon:yes gene_type:complete
MLDYIEANCVLPPLENKPSYNEESGLWELYFEELLPSWYVRGENEHPDLITLNFETWDQVQNTLLQLEQIKHERDAYEATKKDQEPILS